MKRSKEFVLLSVLAPAAVFAESAIVSNYPPANPQATAQATSATAVAAPQPAQPAPQPTAVEARSTTQQPSNAANVSGEGTGATIIIR